MAKETKAEYFSISQENNVIQTWETFGWEVVTTQKCDYHGYDAVKITFSRDKDMKNYERLAELHKLYQNDADLVTKLCEEKEEIFKSVPEPPRFNFIFVFIGFFGLWPLIVYLIIYFKAKKEAEEKFLQAKKRQKEIEEQGNMIVDRMDNYIAEAKTLI